MLARWARANRLGLRNLLGQEPPKMTIAEAQPLGEAKDSFAIHDAVSDQAHGARDTVGAPVPLG